MKVNNPNLPAAGLDTGSVQAAKAEQAARAGNRTSGSQSGSAAPPDDVHLSELVRSLRSLAADSPERQAKIEQLARSYASGSYKPDPHATASAIIQDASIRSSGPK
ncbi:MAG: flagellar biosynthesis anti-sigma factor FlgM [Bryobacteraceae bacterium]